MEPVTPAVNADSTPAIPQPEPVITPDDMAKYRQERRQSVTGASKPQSRAVETPASKESEEEQENAAPSGEKPDASTKPAAASEAAQQQEKPEKRSNAQTRKEELNREIQDLLSKRDTLRGEVSGLDTQRKPNSQSAKKEPEPATLRPEPKLEDKTEQGQPKYATWDDWFADVRKWEREATLHEVEQRGAQSRKDAEVETQQRSQADKWKSQIDEARNEYKDFDQVALTRELGEKIPQGSVIEAYVLHRADGAKMLYHLGQHPEKIADILKMDPFDQSEALIAISRGFGKKDTPPAAKPGDKPEPPAKKFSQAPASPIEVGSHAGPVPDELEQAVKDDDMEAYRHARRSRVLASIAK